MSHFTTYIFDNCHISYLAIAGYLHHAIHKPLNIIHISHTVNIEDRFIESFFSSSLPKVWLIRADLPDHFGNRTALKGLYLATLVKSTIEATFSYDCLLIYSCISSTFVNQIKPVDACINNSFTDSFIDLLGTNDSLCKIADTIVGFLHDSNNHPSLDVVDQHSRVCFSDSLLSKTGFNINDILLNPDSSEINNGNKAAMLAKLRDEDKYNLLTNALSGIATNAKHNSPMPYNYFLRYINNVPKWVLPGLRIQITNTINQGFKDYNTLDKLINDYNMKLIVINNIISFLQRMNII